MPIVYVDASAKVEQWTKDTAVAFSDGIEGSILVEKGTKREAREWLRFRYPNRSSAYYQYLLFASFIYLALLPFLDQIEHVCIDQDYTGKRAEDLIKNFLLNFLHRHDPSLRGKFISFRKVAGSKADLLARRIFTGEETADREISLEDFKAIFAK